MAGCCPPAPSIAALGGALADANGPESDIRQGESVECYMVRGGNTTGLQDDATANALNKIENTTVPIVRSATSASVNMQFRLTAGSTRTPTSWTMTETPASALVLSNGGLLTGSWTSTVAPIKIVVTASDGTGVIDSRSYTVAPSIGGESDEIRLISPLPGGIVNSKFGPRMHPIYQVMKPHTGIDMKMSNGSVKDIVAAADGEIILCGGNPTSGYGLRVWIKHNTASGQHLCTTTYNHLAKIYVTMGQKVMAGQKIGLEGSTGASTGNHLHFECKLPDGKFIDPEPLINGSLTVARGTLTNGDADPATLSTRNSSASLSAAEVQAKQDSCAPFGPTYPAATPAETTDPVPAAPITDPFERAWYFTMTHEVGPHWMTTAAFSPGDSELDAGLVETKTQRKKTGYVNSPNFPGGETKFGIAQKPNPRINVRTMDYATSKMTGYNNYWKSSRMPCNDKATRVAIMLFDMNYMHGDGNSKYMYNQVNTVGMTEHQICEALYAVRVSFINGIPRPEYRAGWLKRAKDCLDYVKSF
jgi:murein DD-endopeptidase MepM/ murein hydrolase activator NlpD